MPKLQVIKHPPLILTQIAIRLHDIFDGKIDIADVADKTQEEQDQYFKTRALAALFLLDEAGLSPDEAAQCVTDGYADDGIDGIYVDKKKSRIYFVQSKWRVNMQKGIELSEFTRFRDGVKNVIALNWTDENQNLQYL